MIWPFKKQPLKKTWVASVKGHYPVGIFCREVTFNLYKDGKGNLSYDEFAGCELHDIPCRANFSAKADVEAWKHGGSLPKNAKVAR